jgi:hypothetical protein
MSQPRYTVYYRIVHTSYVDLDKVIVVDHGAHTIDIRDDPRAKDLDLLFSPDPDYAGWSGTAAYTDWDQHFRELLRGSGLVARRIDDGPVEWLDPELILRTCQRRGEALLLHRAEDMRRHARREDRGE